MVHLNPWRAFFFCFTAVVDCWRAGDCIFRIKPGELVFVEGGSVALSTCGDNLEAEAEAVMSGFTRLLDIIEETTGSLRLEYTYLCARRHSADH